MRNSKVGDLLVASTLVEGTILERGVCLLVHDDQERAIGVMLNRPMQIATASVQEHNANEGSSNSTRGATQSPAPPTTPATANDRLKSIPGAHDRVGRQSDQPVTGQTESLPAGSDTSGAAVPVAGASSKSPTGPVLPGSSLYFGGPLSGPVVAIHGTVELAEAEAGDGIFMAAQRDHLETLVRTEQRHPYRLIVGHLGWTHAQLNHEIDAGVWHRMPATSDILWTEDGFLWPALIRRATSQSISRWMGVEHAGDAHRFN